MALLALAQARSLKMALAHSLYLLLILTQALQQLLQVN